MTEKTHPTRRNNGRFMFNNFLLKRFAIKMPRDRQTKRFSRCIIHIGTEKTGSSVIQSFLQDNRKAFGKDGIFYPTLGNGGSQWEIVAAAHPEPWKDASFRNEFGIENSNDHNSFKKDLTAALTDQFQHKKNQDTLIISSEHFHSRLASSKAIALLKEFLEPWVEEFQVLVYFRRQDRVFLSLNSTRLKSGAKTPVMRLPITLENIPRYYRYDHIFKDWSDVFGKEAMIVRKYEEFSKNPDWIFEDFCKACDFSLAGKSIPRRINQSLSEKGLQLLAGINTVLVPRSNAQDEKLRKAIVQFVSIAYAGKYHHVTRQEAMAFYKLLDEPNRAFFEQISHITSSIIFDDDFSEYPDTVNPEDLSVQDALRFAVDLYRNGQDEEARGILKKLPGSFWGRMR